MNSTPQQQLVSARAALSRLFEPSDSMGLALVAAAGPVDALRIATGEVRSGTGLLGEVLQEAGEAGLNASSADFAEALRRWLPRAAGLVPERDLQTITRLGGRLLVPEQPQWPASLLDLGPAMPLCLWTRGRSGDGLPDGRRTIAVVGSRDATGYGLSVAGEISAGLVARGYTVVSGGAYGIDAQAHRSALAAAADSGPPGTIAVLAGGLDRYYPAGNEDLLRGIARAGLLVSEVPPGSAPTRWRFLQRNRIIAALSQATVVVEARWRSGALSTAHHAASLGREVGAVPGSVYSANSAGCHRLLRDGSAVCVTDAAEVAELAAPLGKVPGGSGGGGDGHGHRSDAPAQHDGLAVEDLLLLDALPLRAGSPPEKLAAVAGLSLPAVRAGLGRLELEGLAQRAGTDTWRRRNK